MNPLLTLSAGQFLHDLKTNKLFGDLNSAFVRHLGHRASPSEQNSWNASLPRLGGAIELAGVADDTLVGLECEVPYYGKRIDASIFGHDSLGHPNVVLVELKQWSLVDEVDETSVSVAMSRGGVVVLHPSLQVEGYRKHLKNFTRAFHNDRVQLSGCVYAHNYPAQEGALFSATFKDCITSAPVFTASQALELAAHLKKKVGRGGGIEVLQEIARRGIAPSRELMAFASDQIRNQDLFTMLDEQLSAQKAISKAIHLGIRSQEKTVIVVRGGPGTGKSVIALDALGLGLRKELKTYLVSGSAAFTSGLRRLLGKDLAGLLRFTDFFWNAEPNAVDLLIVDEAHRIRNKSVPRVKAALRPSISQLEELIRAAKVTALFMDPHQIIEPSERGDPDAVAEIALRMGCSFSEINLTTQFRCNGSDSYLTWVSGLFDVDTLSTEALLRPETFDCDVLDSPHELLEWVDDLNRAEVNSARFVAGWCWPWSDPEPDGTLVKDIKVGNFEFPWELKNDKKGKPGIPEARHWAVDPAGAKQAGTVYSVQGFEFRKLAVLMGPDLIVRKDRWVANPKYNYRKSLRHLPSEDAEIYIKRIYRTLFTRPLSGIRIHSVDEETNQFLRSVVVRH